MKVDVLKFRHSGNLFRTMSGILFTKICHFKQSIFTDTVVVHTLPSMCKEYTFVMHTLPSSKLNVLGGETVFIMPYFPSGNISLYLNRDFCSQFIYIIIKVL